jgi:acyl carrier protein
MHVLSLKNIFNKMTKEELILKLKVIVKPYIQDEEAFKNLTEETDFINDLKINSANLVDVILDVEDEFNIEIDNDSMEKMLSVKAAMQIIEEKLSA